MKLISNLNLSMKNLLISCSILYLKLSLNLKIDVQIILNRVPSFEFIILNANYYTLTKLRFDSCIKNIKKNIKIVSIFC